MVSEPLGKTASPKRMNLNKTNREEDIQEEAEEDKENNEQANTSPRKEHSKAAAVSNDSRFEILKYKEEDDEEGNASLVDVNNDQMFDDSIFTEYDDQNISCMGENISSRWRNRMTKDEKKRKKKTEDMESMKNTERLGMAFTQSVRKHCKIISFFYRFNKNKLPIRINITKYH